MLWHPSSYLFFFVVVVLFCFFFFFFYQPHYISVLSTEGNKKKVSYFSQFLKYLGHNCKYWVEWSMSFTILAGVQVGLCSVNKQFCIYFPLKLCIFTVVKEAVILINIFLYLFQSHWWMNLITKVVPLLTVFNGLYDLGPVVLEKTMGAPWRRGRNPA